MSILRTLLRSFSVDSVRRPVRNQRVGLELLEARIQPSTLFRSIDGTGNNLANPTWGSAGTDLLRVAPAAYADGVSSPAGANLPSARTISNSVNAQGEVEILSDRQLSAMIYSWGQFVDHDLDLTPTGNPANSFNIPVPSGDPSFDPAGTGTQVIPFTRSVYDPNTGSGTGNPRQQVNVVTSWLDGSQVYGSDAITAGKLRTHAGGLLKTSAGNLLPINNTATFPDGILPMANDAHLVPEDHLFAAGDVRANENVELLSLQTVFVREHNRIATALSRANPGLDDETVYQLTRAHVIGELQVITYKEWVPALLGPGALPAYHGYDPSVNPAVATEFSTVAYRLGHSLLGNDVQFLDNNGLEVAPAVPLSQVFFNPDLLSRSGIDPILKYLASDPASEVDPKIVDSVRNFLFGPPGAGGLDLASLNIQRGRDHGLTDYNSIRAAFGLPRVTGFDQITANPDLQAKLQQLYSTVDRIDAWVGALAEDHVAGSSTGPLIRQILVTQFERLRDGDRLWYRQTFSGPELRDLERTSLVDVIRRNSGDFNLQSNVFFFKVDISGRVFNDQNQNGVRDRGEHGVAGVTVELIDTISGTIAGTATTDAHGRYDFNIFNGLRVGQYQVQVVLPTGAVATTPTQPVLALTRGDSDVDHLDLGIAFPGAPRPPQGHSGGWHPHEAHVETFNTVAPDLVVTLIKQVGQRHEQGNG